ncbi:SRPBCC family protein [Neobacillus sp. 179-C4.2 HS]|uniref:SRPBCC family protein n=1 Tax=Neobacillus driksii TaxID=3035913 RepID=A0ABV4YY61_9BACI|nr:SRPBCC family protein [Neobacillus sp. 179.-C4.2 HS]MDP5195737.1 SRPBCC family protein [Neobacillus sp. 179.-C4.2 HS]
MMTLNEKPVVKAEMLIRKPVEEVYEAFINPEITTKFWFTKSSGRLEEGKTIRWDWEMYGVGDELFVKETEKNKLIRIEWTDGTQVEWIFTPRADNQTFVSITNDGFSGSSDEMIARAIDSMGGYTMVLSGLKAYLEHNIQLNLVADKAPDANVN